MSAPDGSTHELDWDMTDWPDAEVNVGGIVMAVEGCGGDDDQVTIVTPDGRTLRALGIRRGNGRVEIVVEGC